jgi:starch-binding outer membrane protein, SusD/RagB family
MKATMQGIRRALGRGAVPAAVLVALAGCDFVDLVETPETFISPDRFYQTDAQAQIAVNAIYEPLMSWEGWRQPAQHSIMCDDDEMACESWMGGGVTGNIAGQWYAEGNSVWGGNYTIINRANQVLHYVGASATITPAAKQKALAQAKFARAYAYFDLVRRFGAVPLRTRMYLPDEQLGAIGRSPVDSVWQQITTDLWQAAAELPADFDASHGSGLPRAASAWGLLAKAYLHMAGAEARGTPLEAKRQTYLDSAVFAAQRVMQFEGTSVALEQRYMNLFDVTTQNSSREVLFAVQGNRGNGSNIPAFFSPAGDCTLVGGCGPAGPGFVNMRPDFVATFDARDKRWERQVAWPTAWVSMPGSQSVFRGATNPVIHRDSMAVLFERGLARDTLFIGGDGWTQECNSNRLWPGFYQVTLTNPNGNEVVDTVAIPHTYYSLKYVDRAHSGSEYGNANNFVILRYADVLLVLAEAENERNGPTAIAHSAINKVRERAGLPALNLAGKDGFRDAVRLERRHELYGEFQRRFDLIRYGTYLEEMNRRVTTQFGQNRVCRPRQPFQVLQPIPTRELAANPLMIQNPGY